MIIKDEEEGRVVCAKVALDLLHAMHGVMMAHKYIKKCTFSEWIDSPEWEETVKLLISRGD